MSIWYYMYSYISEDVDSATLEKILNMYYLDFKLFDYDIQIFINILDSKRASEKNSGKDSPWAGKEQLEHSILDFKLFHNQHRYTYTKMDP